MVKKKTFFQNICVPQKKEGRERVNKDIIVILLNVVLWSSELLFFIISHCSCDPDDDAVFMAHAIVYIHPLRHI